MTPRQAAPSPCGLEEASSHSHTEWTPDRTRPVRGTAPMDQAAHPPDEVELLHRAPLFAGLALANLQVIARASGRRQALRGAAFFRQGEPATQIHVLVRGRVKLTRVDPEGREVLVRFVGPAEMFGGIAALGDSTYPVSAEAVTSSETLAWHGETMTQLMRRFPEVALNAMRLMAGRIQELQTRLAELVAQRVEQRVARALLRLAQQAGRRVEEGVLIDLPLSRQDLAELTGTTLYTVSRILSRWESQGFVASSRERVVIRIPHALVTLAEDLRGDE